MPGPRQTFADLDRITPENQKWQTKLIFFKIPGDNVRWHIALPQMTQVAGFLAFCGLISWSTKDTSNRQRLEMMMQQERGEFCDRCAEELIIAFDELQRQGYL